jgi:DNA polymerase III subunit epsilon
MSAPTFAAIDFETADYGQDSACAVGVVRCEGGRIVKQERRLIKPPRRDFKFSYIHGIEWSHVEKEKTFAVVWSELEGLLDGAEFLAAHNAPFDRGVLAACCAAAKLPAPPQPFLCTVRLARRVWNIRPTKLPNVCERLGFDLNHHEALSDAVACAKIVLAAHEQGAALAA